MKIRKLQLKNISVFDDETIEFQPCPVKDKAEIHIFTGQNGSGKSTILTALASAFDESSSRNSLRKRFNKEKLIEGNSINIELANGVKISIDNSNGWKIDVESLHKLNNGDWIPVNESVFNYIANLNNISPQNLTYAVFAIAGYRHIQSEPVEAHKELKGFAPLSQSLDFVKDYNQENQFSINQLIVNNISNRALAMSDDSFEEAEKYEAVIKAIEKFIKDVTDCEVKFILKRSPNELKLRLHADDLDFDVLPDGLRSLISWIADLLGKVDLVKWQDALPINEKNLILFLDEIEVHLHPAWQRKVLPVVQKLFKNSQIFVSTHSPFVVNSVDDAWVYRLEVGNGKAKVAEVVESENSYSISQVLRDVFGVDEKFGKEVQDKLDKFENLKDKILSNGSNVKNEKELLKLAKSLADEPSDELKQIVLDELRQLSRIKGKEYSL